jgi:hypothetical protein
MGQRGGTGDEHKTAGVTTEERDRLMDLSVVNMITQALRTSVVFILHLRKKWMPSDNC